MSEHRPSRKRKIRVLVAKPGLDGHDRGAKVVARALRDAGMEIIYTGLRQTPEMITESALQEDVDVVGISSSTLGHMPVLRYVKEGLVKEGRDDILLILGGIIPDDDLQPLKDLGVEGVFGPGSTAEELIQFIDQNTM